MPEPPDTDLVVDGRLAHLLSVAGKSDAISVLNEYFEFYEGGNFERLGGGGDRPEVANQLTAEDVIAVSMLAATINTKKNDGLNTTLRLLTDEDNEFGKLLAQMPFSDQASGVFDSVPIEDITENWAPWRLYRRLKALPNIDETTATKLLARKRPHLVPIVDSVVRRELGRDRAGRWEYWVPLHRWLNQQHQAGCTNSQWLRQLGDDAGLTDVSTIRIFDVLAWMVGKERG